MPFSALFRISTRSFVVLLVPFFFALVACGSQTQSADTGDLVKISAPTVDAPVAGSPTAGPVSAGATAAPASATGAATAAAATTAPASNATTATAAPASPTTVPQVAIPPLKKGVLLEPMSWEPQTWNNCAPVSVEMVMSYYGVKLTQKEAAAVLKPNDGDKHVEPHQIVSYVQNLGFKIVQRENGSLATIRALVSAGIPVITQQWLYENDDIGHYRVVRGYDTTKNILIYNDSMDRHPNTVVPDDLETTLWKGFDNRYFPIYTAQQEPLVMAILGADADASANMQRAIAAAKARTQSQPDDIDGWRDLGYLDYATGDYTEAITIWEQHLTKMLKPSDQGPYNRFLWYQLWPVESYNKVGNYQKVLDIAPHEIAQTKVYAEARYQYAIALMNTGQKDAAITQLKQAVQDDIHFADAPAMLAKLGVSPA